MSKWEWLSELRCCCEIAYDGKKAFEWKCEWVTGREWVEKGLTALVGINEWECVNENYWVSWNVTEWLRMMVRRRLLGRVTGRDRVKKWLTDLVGMPYYNNY